jgi:hypothetical protein
VSSPVSEAHSKFRGLMAERDAERLDACRPGPVGRAVAPGVRHRRAGGRRSVIAVVVNSTLARAVLAALGLPCTPTTFAPARDPQGELWFDDAS